ncbi:exodeoxyribonuclease VII small subunit [Demequina pelophila]|uniref:exodeoxyribonuclease VII small subunit n=1 Tax=Demequina pelophila TaxID=1638984 RepID=UPI000785AF2A|nr:exodeoxyribonuclease VII small subunit [Demequina pelophila]
MPDSPFTRPLETLSYEEARDELVAIVARLEAGAATLDESVTLWERGEALAARCQELLDGAQDRIDAARAADDARVGGDAAGAAAAGDEADAGVVGIVPDQG